ncbi:flagellar biosynthetic protein FliO [Frigoribacterium faeni]|uniref:flagellar biosynthetic protein FliO n=1 Tax=Frigoribacterium faeni TaxID=145483 RepID=UPI00141B12ED|nr:flagellar biogenesis protein FliO [Frigoribacterium faeni]
MDTLFVALRVALSLGVVLALLWVLQKRIAKGGLRPGRASAPVTVVARQGIGAKASVVVVDVEGERLVLGVTESSVTVLAAADVPAPVEPPLALVASSAPAVEAPQEARVTPIVPVASPSFDAVLAADASADASADGAAAAGGAPMLRPRGAERRAAARDPRERARGRSAKAIEGSILAPDTWRQAAAAVRAGRAG